ncbi:MAG: uroporphyrinogen-III C-methyltransferase [Alphaproteobacteria bacterium]
MTHPNTPRSLEAQPLRLPQFGSPPFRRGSVWVAGAGPGSPELLTLGALGALQQADVVIYDALVSAQILEFARAGTVLEYAGKRGGKPSPRQSDITLRLIRHAKDGRRVLRLKGGDPFVFGRGGEELAGLIRAGVPFRIIPGITAASGGLSAIGIPLTHRDVNQCVALVTGHDSSGKTPGAIDWRALSLAAPVIVFYMALNQLDEIVGNLLRNGRRTDEPVALLENATLPEERLIESSLGGVIEAARVHKLRPPVLFVVGEVVRRRLVSVAHPQEQGEQEEQSGQTRRVGS